MKKGIFHKLMGSGEMKRAIPCEGYIDEDNQIAYAKKTTNFAGTEITLDGWEATDIKIGVKFAEGRTKKECIENAMKVFEAINKARNGNSDFDYNETAKVLIFLITYKKWADDKLIKRKVG